MRLTRYLTEDDLSYDEIAAKIGKDCSQIMKLYSRSKPDVLYRGVATFTKPNFLEKKGRISNRTPRDTPKPIHDYLNKIFKKKFGWPVRNGISTTGAQVDTYVYGQPYVFFPFNGYKFAWSIVVRDLTSHMLEYYDLQDLKDFKADDIYPPENYEGKPLDDFLEELAVDYRSTDLAKGIKWLGEIMFNVKKYYLVERHVWDEMMRQA